MIGRQVNQRILENSRRRIDGMERQAHQTRLRRWGEGPDITADSIFWKILEAYDVSVDHLVAELTWARREYGIGAIQSPQSWGRGEHQYYCPESLPADFPPLMTYLGQLRNGLLSIKCLGIGRRKYQAKMVSTGGGTTLYIQTKQQLSDTAIRGLDGSPLSMVVKDLQDDRVITQARMANHQGYPCLSLRLEPDLHTHVIQIDQGQQAGPSFSRETPGWTQVKTKKLEQIVAEPERDRKLTRSYTTIEPWVSKSPGGHSSRYALLKEYKPSSSPGTGELYKTPPTPSARWDHRHACWTVSMKELLEGELRQLRRRTACIKIVGKPQDLP